MSPMGRVLFIVIVEWEVDVLRIISARKANIAEQNDYAERKT
jgi:uncharacterized DUF497 family protein